MEKELDPLVIKTTQASLGKYVKRPPLNEKLLKKPPFRFLHDIVTSVLKTTGFFEGLFDEDELVSENVKDRENKIVFLNKVITVVGLTTGKPLAVKPSKIVAGQEPEKTNELLQCIAQALDKKLSSDEAVKKFKEGAKLPKPDEKKLKDTVKTAKKTSEVSKLTSKSSDKLFNHKKDAGVRTINKYENEGKNVSKSKQKEKLSTKTETPPKSTSQPSKLATSKKPSVEKKNTESSEKILDVNITEANGEKHTKVDLKVVNDGKDEKLELENQQFINSEPVSIEQNELNNSYTIVDNGLNSSLSSQDLMESNGMEAENNKTVNTLSQKKYKVIENTKNIDQTESSNKVDEGLTQNLTEEEKEVILNKVASSVTQNNITSELLAKGEVKESNNAFITRSPSKVNSVVRPASVRPSSSRPGAPRPRDKHDNILTEAENIIVGKVNIIAENYPNEEEEDTSIIIIEKGTSDLTAAQNEQEQLQGTLNDHGHLVQQILDSQKEYSQMSGKTEIEWQFGAQKARDASNKEVEQLRFDIQALSRVANPLGKLLDHIQEDVEVMRQELSQWTKTYEQTSKELVKQKAANVDSLFPLYAKVKQLDTDVDEKCDKINDLKIILHKNSLRIEKLLSNGKVQ